MERRQSAQPPLPHHAEGAISLTHSDHASHRTAVPATCDSAPRHAETNLLRVWRNMLFSHSAIVQRLSDDLHESTGLTIAQYDVLLRLQESADGALRMGELLEGVLVTTSGLTRVVDRLQSDGYVARVRDTNDRRGVRVSITGEGERVLTSASAIHREGIERYFTRFIADDEAPALDSFFARLFAETNGTPPVEDLPAPTVPPARGDGRGQSASG